MIYEISDDLREIINMIECAETAEDLEAATNCLVGLQGEVGDIVDRLVKTRINYISYANSVKLEIERLKDRMTGFEKTSQEISRKIIELMGEAKLNNIRTELFSVTVVAPSKSVNVFDETLLTDEFLVVKTSVVPNKKAISDAIKSDREVPGAALVDGNKSLRIK